MPSKSGISWRRCKRRGMIRVVTSLPTAVAEMHDEKLPDRRKKAAMLTRIRSTQNIAHALDGIPVKIPDLVAVPTRSNQHENIDGTYNG